MAAANPLAERGERRADYGSGDIDDKQTVSTTDTNAVQCPALPEWRLHRLPAVLVRSSAALWVLTFVAAVPFCVMTPGLIWVGDDGPGALEKVAVICSFASLLPIFTIAHFYRRATTLGKECEIELLGAGVVLVSKEAKAHLDAWNRVLLPLSLFLSGLFSMFFVAMMAFAREANLRFMPVVICFGCAMMSLAVGLPVAVAWWHSLKVAASLASDAITEVIKKIQQYNPSDAEWDSDVVPSTLKLATHTLPQLSRGWGTSLALGACAVAFIDGTLFCWLLQYKGNHYPVLIIVVSGLGLAMAADVASASSKCDHLVTALNNKRIECKNVSHDEKLRFLERVLENLNTRQGLGFTVLGTVVNRKTLAKIVAGVVGLGSTVLPIIVALSAGKGEQPLHVAGDVYQFSSGRFFAVNTIKRSYNESIRYCASRGMWIGSIHSPAESETLEWVLTDEAFLGGTQVVDEIGGGADGLSWVWEDGSPWNYQHKTFMRDNAEPGQHLVVKPMGGWVNSEMGYIKQDEERGLVDSVTGEHLLSVVCTMDAPAAHDFCGVIEKSPGGQAWAHSTGACHDMHPHMYAKPDHADNSDDDCTEIGTQERAVLRALSGLNLSQCALNMSVSALLTQA